MTPKDHGSSPEFRAANYEAQGKKYISQLFQDSPSFEYLNLLDTRAKFDRPGVFKLRYTGTGPLPISLGKWPFLVGQDAGELVNPGTWLQEPEEGREVALKLRRYNISANREFKALLRTNTLFSEEDAARPPRFFGYGFGIVSEAENLPRNMGMVYYIEETVPPRFRNYNEIHDEISSWSPSDTVDFVAGVTGFVNRLHQAGIAHADLEVVPPSNHLLYDKATKQLRVLDWSESVTAGDPEFEPSIGMDFEGLRRIVQHLPEVPQNPQARVLRSRIITDSNATFVDEHPDDNFFMPVQVSGYPRLPSGTAQLYADVLRYKEYVDAV